MPKKWLFGSSYVNYVVARREDLFPPEAGTLDPKTFKENFDQWADNPEQREALIDMWQSVGGGAGGGASGLDVMRRQLLEAFNGGELVMLRTRPREVLPRLAETTAPGAPEEQEREERKTTTWVEIQLLDNEGKPVPNERYRIEMPDGSVEDGFLDDQGSAFYDGIDPGSCKVTFPEIDANEWQPA